MKTLKYLSLIVISFYILTFLFVSIKYPETFVYVPNVRMTASVLGINDDSDNHTGPGEACDGTDVNGYTCATVAAGFQSGTLTCNADRKSYNTSQCVVGNTIPATSCSYDHVSSAVAQASSGDIVTVPSGNCVWDSAVTIPDDKRIVIQGSGKTLTNISMSSSGTVFSLGKSGSRITNIGFINGTIMTKGFNFRVDHCRMYFTTNTAGIDSTPVNLGGLLTSVQKGLIDNNEFINTRILATGGPMLLYNDNQHFLWSTPLNLGTDESIYLEDNVFIKDGGNVIDSNYGGSFVFRYNNMTGSSNTMAHSSQGGERGTRKWELYGNIINNSGSTSYGAIFIRGGTGSIFFNEVVGRWSQEIVFDNVRDTIANYDPDDNLTGLGLCDGNNMWDGNYDETGWPCRDQIGTSYDSPQWEDNPVVSNNQSLAPVYMWLNKKDLNEDALVYVVPISAEHIIKDRDYYESSSSFDGTSGVGCGLLSSMPLTCTEGVGYWATEQSCDSINSDNVGANPVEPINGTLYKCTSTNNWEAYYVPYVYPHPLSLIDPTPTTTYTLNITTENGTVSKNPDKATYVAGEQVILEAINNPGYTFTGWSGALTGSTNPVTITIGD